MLITDELLMDFKRCDRRSFLNIYGDFSQKNPEREFVLKLRQENHRQIEQILARKPAIKTQYQPHNWEEGSRQTIELMKQGVDRIYRGVLLAQDKNRNLTFLGQPTFLIKQPGLSRWGNWLYVPINVKLGKTAKSEYKIVATFQAYLLSVIQEAWSPPPQLILRGQKSHAVDLDNWFPRFQETLQACLTMLLNRHEPEVFISRQRCSLCHWLNYCQGIAREQNHLSLVPGITPSRYQELQALGVQSLEDLGNLDSVVIGDALEVATVVQLQQQARSLLENRPFFRTSSPSPLPQAPIELYFDIEAEPDRNLDYLLGVLCVNHLTQTETFYYFLAEQPEEEPLIWQQFLALIWRYPQAPIFHFSDYEVEALKRLSKLYTCSPQPLPSILARCVDLHQWIVTSVTLPVENYSLKTLGKWVGFAWRDPDSSGDRTVWWYDLWLKTGDRSLLEAILRYNEDDCRATYHLKKTMEKVDNSQTHKANSKLP